jgi:hypothetical protein
MLNKIYYSADPKYYFCKLEVSNKSFEKIHIMLIMRVTPCCELFQLFGYDIDY